MGYQLVKIEEVNGKGGVAGERKGRSGNEGVEEKVQRSRKGY